MPPLLPCPPSDCQVQSEMLKKWKRWKLGLDIDEECRHTHSQMPHVKSGGSLAAAATTATAAATSHPPPYHHNTHCSEASGDSPRPHAKRAKRQLPPENRQLVVSYSHGGRGPAAAAALRFSFLLPRISASRHVSTATEDLRLEERAQCGADGEEADV